MANLGDFAHAGQGFLQGSTGLLPFFQREQSIDIARQRTEDERGYREEMRQYRENLRRNQIIESLVKQAKEEAQQQREEAFTTSMEGHAAGLVPVEQARAAAIRAGKMANLDQLFPGYAAAERSRAATRLGDEYFDPEPPPPPIRENIDYEQGIEDNLVDFTPAEMERPRRRKFYEVQAEQAASAAEAKVTPEQRQRAAVAERRADVAESRESRRDEIERERLDLERRRTKISEREVSRKETKDREVRERIGATIKTMEADAIKMANELYQNNPVKRRAFLEKIQMRMNRMKASMGEDKSMATLEKELRDELAALNGEIAAVTPEAVQPTQGWFSNSWQRLREAIMSGPSPELAFGELEPAPQPAPRSMPGRVPAAPAPTPPAPAAQADADTLKQARDNVVRQLFGDRQWGDLSRPEKEQVLARLNAVRPR